MRHARRARSGNFVPDCFDDLTDSLVRDVEHVPNRFESPAPPELVETSDTTSLVSLTNTGCPDGKSREKSPPLILSEIVFTAVPALLEVLVLTRIRACGFVLESTTSR